jgi:hypothetical protein
MIFKIGMGFPHIDDPGTGQDMKHLVLGNLNAGGQMKYGPWFERTQVSVGRFRENLF